MSSVPTQMTFYGYDRPGNEAEQEATDAAEAAGTMTPKPAGSPEPDPPLLPMEKNNIAVNHPAPEPCPFEDALNATGPERHNAEDELLRLTRRRCRARRLREHRLSSSSINDITSHDTSSNFNDSPRSSITTPDMTDDDTEEEEEETERDRMLRADRIATFSAFYGPLHAEEAYQHAIDQIAARFAEADRLRARGMTEQEVVIHMAYESMRRRIERSQRSGRGGRPSGGFGFY